METNVMDKIHFGVNTNELLNNGTVAVEQKQLRRMVNFSPVNIIRLSSYLILIIKCKSFISMNMKSLTKQIFDIQLLYKY